MVRNRENHFQRRCLDFSNRNEHHDYNKLFLFYKQDILEMVKIS